jgi:hypothetical protein
MHGNDYSAPGYLHVYLSSSSVSILRSSMAPSHASLLAAVGTPRGQAEPHPTSSPSHRRAPRPAMAARVELRGGQGPTRLLLRLRGRCARALLLPCPHAGRARLRCFRPPPTHHHCPPPPQLLSVCPIAAPTPTPDTASTLASCLCMFTMYWTPSTENLFLWCSGDGDVGARQRRWDEARAGDGR